MAIEQCPWDAQFAVPTTPAQPGTGLTPCTKEELCPELASGGRTMIARKTYSFITNDNL